MAATQSHPCAGFTLSGDPCRNTIADPNRRLCGRCAGDRPAANATIDNRDALIAAANRAAAPVPAWQQGEWGADDDLEARSSHELVMGLRGHAAQAVRLAGRTDPTSMEQAATAHREAARHDDAILSRHPDPYGAALSTHAWETAGDADEDTSEPARIRKWLANTPEAAPDDIHAALNRNAELTLTAEQRAANPWVDDLNRYTAYRAAHMNGVQVDETKARAAAQAWQRHERSGV